MTSVELFLQYMLTASKYLLIILSLALIARCVRSMLSERYEPEVWAYLRLGGRSIPVNHWENLIGRSYSSDIRIVEENVSRVHAVLSRSDNGMWKIYDIFSKGGVWVNGIKVGRNGIVVENSDIINFAGTCVRFVNIDTEKRRRLESSRTGAGVSVSPAVTLVELTLFQCVLVLQHMMSAEPEYRVSIALAFASLAAMQWMCFLAMRVIDRRGFEVETLAFYLTSLGMSVAATSTPEDMYRQTVLTAVAVGLFLINGWWLRNLRRTAAMRIPVGVLALLLLALNALGGESAFGARNWLSIGGYSFQPSEFIKAAYIYAGASTLDRLYRRQNLYGFIAFSAACVAGLALIGDFGTALIFFVSFLVISFMRSGSIATVFLAVAGAGMAGFLAVSIKPYIARRFEIWGHVWEDIYDMGYQQSRAMSAAAAGGFFGKGAGNGWLHHIAAANTDMVFAMVCEELGLIIAVCMVLAVLTLALFAVRTARSGRSAYCAIAACATVSMLMVQLALNVFGSLDILPFTGVTFPFVSRGGSSLLSCWMLMAFLKSADNRRGASFAVSPVKEIREYSADDYRRYEDFYDEDEEDAE